MLEQHVQTLFVIRHVSGAVTAIKEKGATEDVRLMILLLGVRLLSGSETALWCFVQLCF